MFPFQGSIVGNAPPKPMQWPKGAQPEEDDWEFFPEAIKAWRAWRVIQRPFSFNNSPIMSETVLMLQSITYLSVWVPKQEMIAECTPMNCLYSPSSKSHSHACPDVEHGCGLYSVKTEAQALEWKKHRVTDPCVWGQVNIWGHVYKFTKGYLSEFAYPAVLYVPNDLGSWNGIMSPEMLALELSETYGIEAVTL